MLTFKGVSFVGVTGARGGDFGGLSVPVICCSKARFISRTRASSRSRDRRCFSAVLTSGESRVVVTGGEIPVVKGDVLSPVIEVLAPLKSCGC